LVLARFYRSEDESERLHQNLKLTLCPHCKAVGTLILHGKLYGYTEHDDCRKSCRGKRVFCNNTRRARTAAATPSAFGPQARSSVCG
jgi:hypothetical protein